MRKIKSSSILNENTYLLICWRLQEAEDYKKQMKIFAIEERKKMRWNERGEKWIEGAVAEIYSAVLPMDSPTTYLNNIIFNYSVGEFSNVRR
jgi:hypothetical protein